MQDFANISHPLKRDGRSVADRTLPALAPSANPIDGRGWKELLFFLYEMSGWVKHYSPNKSGMSEGDWRVFLKNSTPVQLALISQFESKKVEAAFENLNDELIKNPSFAAVNALLDYGFEIIYLIENWRADLQKNDALFGIFLHNLIKSNLKFILYDFAAIANAAQQWGYQSGHNHFQLQTQWDLALSELFKTDSMIAQTKISQEKRLIIAQQKLQDLFRLLLKNLKQIVEKAPRSIEESLDNRQDHTPHLGLLFAFIKLWQLLQTDLNQLTKRHLDFFYKEVLCLKKKAIVPDKAHLIFELAKKVEAQPLDKGFLFKGQDAEDNDIQFSLDQSIVLQKAQIADLRTLYLQSRHGEIKSKEEGEEEVIQQFCHILECIFKAPVANSADGLGEGFRGIENPTWKTLGWPESKQLITPPHQLPPYFQAHPFANFGFLLASQVLLLQEGNREITIAIKGNLGDVFNENSDEYTAFQAALKNEYYVITEDSLKAAVESGMKASIAAYFEKYIGQAFTEPQLDNLIENRIPAEDRDNKDSAYLKRGELFEIADDSIDNLSPTKAFDLCFSGEEAWLFANEANPISITLEPDTDDFGNTPGDVTLSFEITLLPDFEPVVCYDSEVFGIDYNTELPVAKLALNPSIKYVGFGLDSVSLYHVLRDFKIDTIGITTIVDGVCNLLVQNDDGILDAAKPFQPFGAIPSVGSNFYVGSAEVFSKKLTKLDLYLTWENLPDWSKQYEGYPLPDNVDSIDEDYFEGDLYLLKNNAWGNAKENIFLFKEGMTGLKKEINLSSDCFKNMKLVEGKTLPPYDFNSKTGFLKLVLTTDFLHEIYPDALATQMLAKGKFPDDKVGGAIYDPDFKGSTDDEGNTIVKKEDVIIPIPKPPYTPTLQKVSINYTAVADHDTIDFIHLHPFENTYEHKRLPVAYNAQNPLLLLPKFTEEGHLFIGLKDLEVGSQVNLLFQMVESTANPDLDKAEVKWAYLKDNRWGELKPDFDILADETNGLIQSGIVNVKIPWDITDDNTILPKGTFWLRITAAKNVEAIAETIMVYAQAAKVTFAEDGINFERLSEPLAAGSLTKPVQALSTIKSMNQSYASFGGRAPESDQAYYRRASERLRHKGRGITLFDYETLVLEEFPEIFKAKCITHTLGKKGMIDTTNEDLPDYELSPGFVTVAVIPDVSKLKISNKIEPKATLATLKKIEAYLKLRISPFVRLKVLNPLFERVSVKANVKFKKGVNESFYEQQLATDLEEFLAPWAFGGPSRISFGGKMSKSAILNFIEKRDYVNYLTDLKMLNESGVDFQEIFAKAARSILTTGKHQFTAITKEFCTDGNARSADMKGLGYMKIGSDEFTIPLIPDDGIDCEG